MKQRLIMVIGPAGAGKTTFANMLANKLDGAVVAETSRPILERAAAMLDISMDEMRRTKHLHRNLLVEIGNQLCAENPAALVQSAAAMHPWARWIIIDGLRRPAEFHATQSMFHRIIFIDRVGSSRDNFRITADRADCIIINNGGLGELEGHAVREAKICEL
jgi:Ni2+-binding GTPase involved in maturation of urease and hydrogenase